MAFTLIEEAVTPNALAATSKSITFSEAPSEGELITIDFSVNNAGADYQVSVPGFSAGATQSDGAFRTVGTLYKVAGASESSVYTMSMTGSAVLTGIGRRFSGALGTVNANTIIHEATTTGSISDSISASAGSIVTAYAYTSSTETKSWNAGWQPQQSPYRTTGVYKISSGGTETATMTLDNSATNNRLSLSLVEFTAAATGPTLDTVPSTAYPGQSRTVTGTGFGATQGTGGIAIGGVTQTITAWSDTSITFTTVLGVNSYGSGKTIEVTTDGDDTGSVTIEIIADTANGFGFVTMSSPDTTDESSVAFGATPTVVTGDQFEWEDFNDLGNLSVNAEGFVTVDTEGTFRGRFWDASDETWGTVEDFDAEVPVVDEPEPGVSGIRFLMKGNIKSTIKTTIKG